MLILGGGFAGLGAARKLRKADVDVVLVDARDYHTFQPMVYQLATGLIGTEAVAHPLRDIFDEQANVVVHQATVEGVRLRCASHNQYTAECTFGAEFMANKREEARRARAEARAAAHQTAEALEQAAIAAERAKDLDVVPWLRKLGFRADEARQAAAHCDNMVPVAPLEERLRTALRFLSPPARRWCPATGTP